MGKKKDELSALVKQYKKLGFSLVLLKKGSKTPIRAGWNNMSDSDAIPAGYNVGLKHYFSATCCIDIDNIKALKKGQEGKLLWKCFKKHPGIRFTSGKKNRVKILYALDTGEAFNSVPLPNNAGSIHNATQGLNNRPRSVQDVLPPSLHPEGTRYRWLDKLPKKREDIPKLPKGVRRYVVDRLEVMSRERKGVQGGPGVSSYPWIQGVNDFCHKHGLMSEFMELLVDKGDYLRVGFHRGTRGTASYKRAGSTGAGSIIIVDGSYGLNFSTEEAQSLPYSKSEGTPAPFRAYDVLVASVDGDYKLVRKALCNGIIDTWLTEEQGYNFKGDKISHRIDKLFDRRTK